MVRKEDIENFLNNSIIFKTCEKIKLKEIINNSPNWRSDKNGLLSSRIKPKLKEIKSWVKYLKSIEDIIYKRKTYK